MRRFAYFVLTLLSLAALAAARTDRKRLLTEADIQKWEYLSAATVSNDGRWIAYGVSTARTKRLDVKSTDLGNGWATANGSAPVFSEDSQHVAYLLGSKERPQCAVRNLRTGKEKTWDGMTRFEFAGQGRFFLARPEPNKPDGPTEMVVEDLRSSTACSIASVQSESPAPTGELCVIVKSASDNGQTVELTNLAGLKSRVIVTDTSKVHSVCWAKNAKVFALVVSGKGSGSQLAVVSNIEDPKPKVRLLELGGMVGKRLSTDFKPRLNDDGTAVLFGFERVQTVPEPGAAHVEVWNTLDMTTGAERRVQSSQFAHGVTKAIWNLTSGTVCELNSLPRQSVLVSPDMSTAVVSDVEPYRTPMQGINQPRDVYVVRTSDGQRARVFAKAPFAPFLSQTGRYIACFDNGNWWLFDCQTGVKRNLTATTGVSFRAANYTFPAQEIPAQEEPVWLNDDSALLLFDTYDVWRVSLSDGSATRVTSGRAQHRQFRIDSDSLVQGKSDPLYLSVFDQDTKESGIYRLDSKGEGRMMLFGSFEIRDLQRARSTNRYVYRQSAADQSPQWMVASDGFTHPRAMSMTNPWQAELLWGKHNLLTYESGEGTTLHANLIYPADFDATKRYPMVVYVYEMLSDTLNSYFAPNEKLAMSPQMLSQRGYFVLMPDIVYEKHRAPGEDALACSEAALDAALESENAIDEHHVGVIGSSWGGYEAAYIATMSKRFSVGAIGSAPTDFASLAGLHFWKFGLPNSVLVEQMQPRMEVPFWEDSNAYIASSLLWQAKNLSVPLLIQVADKDEIVDWTQGVSLYNALRRLGKQAVMLVYLGEKHQLEDEANQLDYARRLRHYLDVYLKGAAPEAWVVEGYRD